MFTRYQCNTIIREIYDLNVVWQSLKHSPVSLQVGSIFNSLTSLISIASRYKATIKKFSVVIEIFDLEILGILQDQTF